MGAWNKDGHKGYWHVDRPHAVTAHMVGIGGKHQHGKKLGFKVRAAEWQACGHRQVNKSLQQTMDSLSTSCTLPGWRVVAL